MRGKTLITAIIAGLLTFISGWFLYSNIRPSNQTKDTQIIQDFTDTGSQTHATGSNNFVHTVSGYFVLAGSNCAGFNFVNHDIVLWINEIACNDPDTLKVRWLSDSAFMTRSTLRIDEGCPPKVDIYKVVSFDGKHLILKNIWTGWNDYNDEMLKFIKRKD